MKKEDLFEMEEEYPGSVDFRDKLEALVTEHYGHRCESIGVGCACCHAWALFDLYRIRG